MIYFIIKVEQRRSEVPEEFSGITRNQVGSAGAGSNPAVQDVFNFMFMPFFFFKFKEFTTSATVYLGMSKLEMGGAHHSLAAVK